MPTDQPRDKQWELLVRELRGHEDEQRREWADVDEVLISRYLAGQCDRQERELVEQAARSFSSVRECIDLAKEVLADPRTAAPTDEATSRTSGVLAPASSGLQQRSIFRRLGRAVFQSTIPSWAAAACLLVAVGLGWLLVDRMNSLRTQVAALNTLGQNSLARTANAELENLRGDIADLKARLPGQEPNGSRVYTTMWSGFDTDSGTSDREVASAVRRHRGMFRMVPYKVTKYVAEQQVRKVPYRVAKMVPEQKVDETGKPYTVLKPVYHTVEQEEHYTVYRAVHETRMREEAVQNLPDDFSDKPPILSAKELMPLLSYNQELVRWAAVDALPRVATGALRVKARVAIVETLRKRDDSGRAAAEYVLTGRIAKGFGADLSKAALDALGGSDRVVRWAGLHYFLVVRRSFEDTGPTVAFFEPDLIERLVRQLVRIVRQEDEDPVLRKAAIYLLGQFGNDAKPAIDDLIQIVTADKDPQARRWAAYALGQIGAEAGSAIPCLAEILKARAPTRDQKAGDIVFPAVAYAFGELCAGQRESTQVKEVVPVLIESLKDPDLNISHWAAFALWRINGPAESALTPIPEPDASLPPPTFAPPDANDPPLRIGPAPW